MTLREAALCDEANSNKALADLHDDTGLGDAARDRLVREHGSTVHVQLVLDGDVVAEDSDVLDTGLSGQLCPFEVFSMQEHCCWTIPGSEASSQGPHDLCSWHEYERLPAPCHVPSDA